jgi:hypothetical protein
MPKTYGRSRQARSSHHHRARVRDGRDVMCVCDGSGGPVVPWDNHSDQVALDQRQAEPPRTALAERTGDSHKHHLNPHLRTSAGEGCPGRDDNGDVRDPGPCAVGRISCNKQHAGMAARSVTTAGRSNRSEATARNCVNSVATDSAIAGPCRRGVDSVTAGPALSRRPRPDTAAGRSPRIAERLVSAPWGQLGPAPATGEPAVVLGAAAGEVEQPLLVVVRLESGRGGEPVAASFIHARESGTDWRAIFGKARLRARSGLPVRGIFGPVKA